jgi:hypothetical protein
MWKVMTLVLAGASLAQVTIPAANGCATEPAAVHLEGNLEYDDGRGPRIPEAGVWIGPYMVIKGQWYGLDFSKSKELAENAKKLYGERVRATGTLTVRELPGSLGWFGQVSVLQVETLEPAAGKEDSAWMVVDGTFEARARFGYPAAREAPALSAKDQAYILDFGKNEELRQQALQLDGQTLRLRGTLDGWESFTSMCVPGGERVPVLRVISIEAASKPCSPAAGVVHCPSGGISAGRCPGPGGCTGTTG